MLRYFTFLMTVLCLTLAPTVSTAQMRMGSGIGQTMTQTMAHMEVQSHHQNGAMPAPKSSPCTADAALCAWLCVAGVALAPSDEAPLAAPAPRSAQSLPDTAALSGLSPAPAQRPPVPARS